MPVHEKFGNSAAVCARESWISAFAAQTIGSWRASGFVESMPNSAGMKWVTPARLAARMRVVCVGMAGVESVLITTEMEWDWRVVVRAVGSV